ncbi:MAG: AAA family ATPase [Acidiferrobacterales bacterium]|nr:AAA family ATPase [Acidiferrobacterales bacterium]
MSESHRDAVAHLLYSLKQSGGFVQLTGEVGTGKTTVSRYLLQHLPENVDVALLLNPRINEKEMIETICDELDISYPPAATLKQLLSSLNEYLLKSHAAGRHTVLIIDEAQNLSREVLEQVRLLTNLETSTDKLLQIILIGQPELVNILGRHDLRQLSQRIVGRFKLDPLTLDETREYVRYRLKQAGCERSLFTPSALRLVHRYSDGVPRVINVICDTALMGAYGRNQDKVGRKEVIAAAGEILPESPQKKSWLKRWFPFAVLASALVVSVIGLQSSGAMSRVTDKLISAWHPDWFFSTADEVVGGKSVTQKEMARDQEGAVSETDSGNTKPVHDSSSTLVKSDDVTAKPGEVVIAVGENSSQPGDQTGQVFPQSLEPNDSKVAPVASDTSSRFDLIYRLGVPFRSE